ncbi:MAG: hypothetical protein M3N23_05450, partial [Pseudomonadota bacterium]|nr:hypothetical protein [Pseudomonadota bacterium]
LKCSTGQASGLYRPACSVPATPKAGIALIDLLTALVDAVLQLLLLQISESDRHLLEQHCGASGLGHHLMTHLMQIAIPWPLCSE